MGEFDGQRVTVMGLGRFGGGVGATRWLVERGADVLVTDLEPAEKLGPSVAQIQDLVDRGSVTLRLGGHNVSDFTGRDLVIAGPAVPKPWDNRFLRAAAAAGVRVTTEIGLLVERLPDRARTIAVTGSAGKSTTSAIIHHVLSACGVPSVFGGNIGGSLLNSLGREITAGTWVVLELSSFMLHWIGTRTTFGPHVAVVTNCTSNHADWHGTFEHYTQSKKQILTHQKPGDVAILDASVGSWEVAQGVTRTIVPAAEGVGDLRIPGTHNQHNAAVAVRAATSCGAGVDHGAAEEAVRGFAGLPHRLQFVGARAGVRCYNDSKATTPEATLLAISAFADDPGTGRVHLIAGGYDKGSDLSPISRAAPGLAGLYTIGQTGTGIAAEAGPKGRYYGTLERAVEAALARTRPGDVLLMSPGCASWGQFENYEARGRRFAELVRGPHQAVPR